MEYLTDEQWDYVVIVYYGQRSGEEHAALVAELEGHLSRGGTLAFTYPYLDDAPELWEVLGVASAEDPFAPEDVRATSPVSPVWLETGGVDIDPPASLSDFGDVVSPGEDARIIAEFESSGTPAAIVSHDGRVVVFGIEWDDWAPAVQVGRDTTYYLTGCLPDFDDSGTLDFFDFLAFQNAFAAGDLRADLDRNGVLHIFDFLIFQNAFELGCRTK
jgi:hypothetical protein